MVEPPKRRLWHGGAPGRHVGDLLLPPTDTGLGFTRRDQSVLEGLDQIGQRSDRVYVTPDRRFALAFASSWSPDGVRYRGGSLYIVECDELEPDDDLLSLPGQSFQAASARVLRVAKAKVPPDAALVRAKMNEVLNRHERQKRAGDGHQA